MALILSEVSTDRGNDSMDECLGSRLKNAEAERQRNEINCEKFCKFRFIFLIHLIILEECKANFMTIE